MYVILSWVCQTFIAKSNLPGYFILKGKSHFHVCTMYYVLCVCWLSAYCSTQLQLWNWEKLSIWGRNFGIHTHCISLARSENAIFWCCSRSVALPRRRCWCKWWPRSFCEILLRMTKATLKVHRKCKENLVQEKSNFPQAFNLFWTLDSECPSFAAAAVQMATAICKGQRNVKPF